MIYLKLCFCVLHVDRPIVDQVRQLGQGKVRVVKETPLRTLTVALHCWDGHRHTTPSSTRLYTRSCMTVLQCRHCMLAASRPRPRSHCRQASSVDVARWSSRIVTDTAAMLKTSRRRFIFHFLRQSLIKVRVTLLQREVRYHCIF